MGELLRIPVGRRAERPIEELMAELLAACRRRTGETAEEFAEGIVKASSRRPVLIGASVRAAEEGVHPLPADLMAHAITRAGIDAAAVLSTLIALVAG